jgi:hypothetical protein
MFFLGFFIGFFVFNLKFSRDLIFHPCNFQLDSPKTMPPEKQKREKQQKHVKKLPHFQNGSGFQI